MTLPQSLTATAPQLVTAPKSVSVDIDAIPLAVALVGTELLVDAVNRQLVGLLGQDPTGQPFLGLVIEAHRSDLSDLLEQPGDGGQLDLRLSSRPSMPVAVRMTTTTGGVRLAFFEATADDNPLGDIATKALDVLGQGVVVGDGSRILSAAPSAARLFGRPVEELLEIGSLFSLFEPSEQERFHEIVAECARTGDPMPESFRTALVHPDGEVWPVDLWIKATVCGGRTRTYTVIAEARERAVAEAELAQRATHDRFGHGAGDQVLRVIAERFLETIRASDTAARIGGDEFVVLSEPDDHQEHDQLRHRLGSALREPIMHEGVEISMSASVGLCRFSDGTVDATSILERADKNMYDVKFPRCTS